MSSQPVVVPRDEISRDLESILVSNTRMNVLLVGPPGTGKSTMAHEVASKIGRPIYVVGCHPELSPAEIIGGMAPNGHGGWTPWAPGPAAMAAGDSGYQPGILLVDDVHLLGDSGRGALYKVLDTGAGGQLTLPSGKMLVPHDSYRVVLTTNGTADDLPAPIRDRIAAVVPVMVPSSDQLSKLHPDLAILCEADYTSNSYAPIATYRQWAAMSALWPVLGIAKACVLALGDLAAGQRMLAAMASIGIDEALHATVNLAASMRDGAP